jgi:hypothetical protein
VLTARFDRVTAFRTPTGSAAYPVQTRDVSIVFSSDQNGTDRIHRLREGAGRADHAYAIAAGAPPSRCTPRRSSAASPGKAGVKRLILSHIGQFDLEAASRCEEVLHRRADRRRRSAIHAGAVNETHWQCARAPT